MVDHVILDTTKPATGILANLATALVAAWFFFTRRHSRRGEFNVELKVFESGDPDLKILQVIFLLDTKVCQRIAQGKRAGSGEARQAAGILHLLGKSS
jgi:hypothetical protein